MMTLALPLVAVAAVLHATWNVLLKTSDDPLRVSARAMAASATIITPAVGIAWLISGRPGIDPEGWLLVTVSALLEAAYFWFLSAAYRRGDLSVVYPLARGTAPLLAVIVGLAIFRERLSPPEMAGVLCLAAGIWVVRRPAAAGPALVPALLTGVTIAAYTSVDSVGVHHAPPWLYGWAMSTLTALLLLALPPIAGALSSRPIQSQREPNGEVANPAESLPSWRMSVLLGLMINSGYYLILVALRIAPLAIVAPLRESAIVLVAVWGMWRLHERQGAWLRAAGALTIAVGAVLVAAAGSGS